MINIRTSVQTVLVGAAVEFECLAIGDPQARITWSKLGSRIRPEVIVRGGMMKIERVEQSDAGQYRCTATNDVGAVQSNIILHVQCKCLLPRPSPLQLTMAMCPVTCCDTQCLLQNKGQSVPAYQLGWCSGVRQRPCPVQGKLSWLCPTRSTPHGD